MSASLTDLTALKNIIRGVLESLYEVVTNDNLDDIKRLINFRADASGMLERVNDIFYFKDTLCDRFIFQFSDASQDDCHLEAFVTYHSVEFFDDDD